MSDLPPGAIRRPLPPELVRRVEDMMENAHKILDEAFGLVCDAREEGQPHAEEAWDVLKSFDHYFEESDNVKDR